MAAPIYRVQVADGASAYLLLDHVTPAAPAGFDAPPESVSALVRSTVQLAKEIAAGDLLRFIIDTSARGGSDLEAVVRFDRSAAPHLAVTLFVPFEAKRPDSGLHAVADAIAAAVRARHAAGVAALIAKAGTKEASELRSVMARDDELAAAVAAIVAGVPHGSMQDTAAAAPSGGAAASDAVVTVAGGGGGGAATGSVGLTTASGGEA